MNGFACERVAAEHHFETIVIRRIVAACNHYAAAAAFVDGCKVEHRGGNHADVEDVNAAVCETALNLCHQAGPAQTAVAAECDAGNAFFGGFGSNSFTD